MTAPRPELHLLAGPNGVGKSSLYAMRVRDGVIHRHFEFVNANVYERDSLQHMLDPQARSEAARHWADARRMTLIEARQSFVSETVFSHPSKLDLIRTAQAAGFVVSLYVLCVDDPQILLGRVQNRVQEGGHFVAPERILERYPRTLANLKLAVPLADAAFLYDTASDSALPALAQARLLAIVAEGEITPVSDSFPAWAWTMLDLDEFA